MAVKARSDITLSRVDDGKDGRMIYATSSSAETEAAKIATVSSGTLELVSGVTLSVKFDCANTAANPTLNVNGTGAKAIYTQGVRYAYWQAGATVVFVYDGTSWRVASEPVYANTITVGNASGNNVYIDSDSLDIRNGLNTLATFGASLIDIGVDSTHALIRLCKELGIQQVITDSIKYTLIAASNMIVRASASDGVLNLMGTTVRASGDNILLDGAVKINSSPVADFIVETGTSLNTYGNWTYRKYNSGVMEIWGNFTKTHDGTQYLNFNIAAPSSMKALSTINVSAGAVGSISSGCRYVAIAGITADIWVEPNVEKNKDVWVYIHAFGTWK